MNYKELKIAVLQKMFAITGNTVAKDDTTAPYLSSIPHAANEGMDLIVQLGRPIRAVREIYQVQEMPVEENLVEGAGYGLVLEGGVHRYDLQTLFGETFRTVDHSNVWFEDTEGEYGTTRLYSIEAGRYLILPATKEGMWRVWALCIPDAIKLTEDTADDFEIPLPKECCDILPLYIASQLYKDDDIAMATIWRNEFNVALDAIAATEDESASAGSGAVECTTGWW